MTMRVLVINSGSATVKLDLLDSDDRVVWRRKGPAATELSDERLATMLREAPEADAVGHRVVHGGEEFTGPTLVDSGVLDRLDAYSVFAPLHQPPTLRLLRLAMDTWPGLPHVACFDTSFHHTLPPAAATYPVAAEWRERYPIRRYGFHGLSHAWSTRRVSELIGATPRRLVVCHLGAGASLSAVADGRCVDTTMGFTPLEGLVMATRSGTVDPGLVLWLIQHAGLTPEQVAHGLTHQSGLTGLAGQSDMRTVLNLADAGDEAAQFALDVYHHRLRAGIASMAAALGGLDTLVFTGGVGEHARQVRARAAEELAFLGVRISDTANHAAHEPDAAPDMELTGDGASVRTFRIEAREDLEIARDTRALLRA